MHHRKWINSDLKLNLNTKWKLTLLCNIAIFLINTKQVESQNPSFELVEDEKIENYYRQDTASKCVAIRYAAMSAEVFDNEERELLKDIRTSFIPPDSVVSANCNNKYRKSDMKLQANTKLTEKFNISEHFSHRSNIIHDRCKRNLNKTVKSDEQLKLPTSFNQDQDENKDDEISTFWKGEGSVDEIRKAQTDIMLKYMDEKADPCEDFYQYACGNWERLNPIPKDKASYDTFEMLRESLDIVIKNLLTRNHVASLKDDDRPTEVQQLNTLPELDDNGHNMDESVEIKKKILQKRSLLKRIMRRYKRSIAANRLKTIDLSDAEIKARHLYESCMNNEILQKRGLDPLLDLIKRLGSWPALNVDWSADHFDWLNLTASLRLYNNNIFIVEWVGPDIKNSDENIIQFDQTSLGLPTRDYFLHSSNSVYLDAYREFMISVINLIGVPLANATEVADELITFETELAKITTAPEERTNISLLYHKLNVSELHSLVPEINWRQYLTIVLERPVQDDEFVIMFAINYMKNLVTLFQQTESRTVANYLFWRFIRHRIYNVDDRFQDAIQKFYFILFGREQSPPKWKNCVGQVNTNMGMAVGAMFVRKYFDENSKKDTLDMTHELQESFLEILNVTDWLDENTKTLAAQKLNSMSLRIGYPDFILSHNELNEKYKYLTIDRSKYFENTLAVLIHLTRTEQAKLGQAVNKTAWQTAPAIVNAYYSRNKNQIMFPAGILQPPFYHRYFPKSLNFGGIGVVIGHELTHGFDDKGRLFDGDGNLQRWWSDQAINGFHERASCLISQYGNYTVSEVGIPVDGENTQGENIADNGGVKQSFRAYKKWLANQSSGISANEILSGINLTNTQLFFLNFAQVWCGAIRPEATRNKIKTAVHSPAKFRVIGTLSNSNDFANEFNCPLGSAMNPNIKCSVW